MTRLCGRMGKVTVIYSGGDERCGIIMLVCVVGLDGSQVILCPWCVNAFACFSPRTTQSHPPTTVLYRTVVNGAKFCDDNGLFRIVVSVQWSLSAIDLFHSRTRAHWIR
jgi:hypothetical protein